MVDGGHQRCCERKSADEGGAENDSGEDLPDDLGLSQLDEEIAEELCQADEQKEQKEDGRQIRVRHDGSPRCPLAIPGLMRAYRFVDRLPVWRKYGSQSGGGQ